MRSRLVALAVTLSLLGCAEARAAGTRLLGGFRPVAAEEGSRALWVNPAAIGARGRATAVGELSWVDIGADADAAWRLHGLSLAAGTDRATTGAQFEFQNLPAVPDWTLAVGNRKEFRNGAAFGATGEVRGGNGTTIDGTIGLLFPLGRSMKLAGVVEDVFESDVDGLPTARLWRGGVVIRPHRTSGYLSYDYVSSEADGAREEHWFAFGSDRAQTFRLSFAINTEGTGTPP